MRWFPRVAVLAAVLVGSPAPSRACSKRHQTPFELFDVAETVALVHVRKTPSNSPKQIVAGNVELGVTQLVKGPKATTIIAKESDTSCRARYSVDTDALVFLGSDGLTVGAHDGHVRDAAAWKPVIERWAAATDAASRAQVLTEAIAGGDGKVAAEAIEFLVDEPALLDAITAEQTAKIAKAATTLPKEPMITMLLVRLRDPSAPRRANVALWERSARGVLQAKTILAETDPAKLAAIVVRRTRDADPRRIAAMERCERIRGFSLASFGSYFGGAGSQAMWNDLAE